MKRMLSLLLTVVMVFALATPAFALSLDSTTETQSMKAGEELTIDISLDEAVTFAGFQVEYGYDKSKFEFVSGTWAEGIRQDYTIKASNRRDVILINNFLTDGTGFPGATFQPGLVCTLTFKALVDIADVSNAGFGIVAGDSAISAADASYIEASFRTVLTVEAPETPAIEPWDGTTRTEPATDASGTYLIGTGAELAWFATAAKSQEAINGKLTADIDLGSKAWTPIGDGTRYAGSFDGDGHVVYNMLVNAGSSTQKGLFGKLGSCTISNLGVTGSVTGTGSQYGGLAGTAGTTDGTATIQNCFSDVAVSGAKQIGGLIGYLYNGSVVIRNCYNLGKLTATNPVPYIGGIVGNGNGMTPATITNCYNAGPIGGFPGKNNNPIGETLHKATNCYYLEGCFDARTDQAYPGEALTAAELKEMAQNLGDAYKDGVGGSYPLLTWQSAATSIPEAPAAGNAPVLSSLTVSGQNEGAQSVTFAPGETEATLALDPNNTNVTVTVTLPEGVSWGTKLNDGNWSVVKAGTLEKSIAVKTGEHKIYVRAYNADGTPGQTIYTLNLTNAPKVFDITTSVPEGFVVTVLEGKTQVNENETFQFTIDQSPENVISYSAYASAKLTADDNGIYTSKPVTNANAATIKVYQITYRPVINLCEGVTVVGLEQIYNASKSTFTVDVSEGYDATNMVVKAGDTVLTPAEDGTYTIAAHTYEIKTVTVEGVVKENAASYTVSLPAEVAAVAGTAQMPITVAIENGESYEDLEMVVKTTSTVNLKSTQIDGFNIVVTEEMDSNYQIKTNVITITYTGTEPMPAGEALILEFTGQSGTATLASAKVNGEKATIGNASCEIVATAVTLTWDEDCEQFFDGRPSNTMVAYGNTFSIPLRNYNYGTYDLSGITMGGQPIEGLELSTWGKIEIAATGDVHISGLKFTPNQYAVSVEGTGAEDVTAAETATFGTDYTFSINKAEHADYTVSAKRGSSTNVAVTDNGNGTYTIAGSGIKGDVTITVEKTEQAIEGYTAALSEDKTITTGEEAQIRIAVDNSVETTFNAYRFVLTYDANLLTFHAPAAAANLDITDNNGTITVIGYGADRTCGENVLTLSFTGNAPGDGNVTLVSANVDKSANADVQDAPPATILDGEAVITVSNYTVTLGEHLSGESTVAPGATYTFTATEWANYDYVISATMGGESVTPTDNGDGTYSIANVSGDLVINAEITAKRYDVTVEGTGAADVTAAEQATYNTDFPFAVTKADGFTYENPTVTIGGEAYTLGAADENGTYTIPGTAITGDVVITLNKTEIVPNTYEVTKPGYVSGEDTATEGVDYSFSVTEEAGYEYGEVTVTVGDEDVTDQLVKSEDGTYTIPGELIDGSITIEVPRTEDFGVEVYPYITLKESKTMYLVLADIEPTVRVLYDGKPMYLYDAENSVMAYLVISDKNLEDFKAEANAMISRGSNALPAGGAGMYEPNGDVNGTRLVDVNDAQLVYDMYNAKYDSFEFVNIQKFLNADMNGDYKVDVSDAAAIVAIIKAQ